MKITLQFIRRPIVPWWGLTVMLATGIASIIAAHVWLTHDHSVQANKAHLEQLQSKLKEQKRFQLQQQNSLTPQEVQRIKNHTKIIDALNYPWNQVFGEIEQTQEPGVAILAFSHDQSGAISQLTVEALDTPSIIRYVQNMNGTSGQNHWYISNYQVQPQNSPQTVKANLVSK